MGERRRGADLEQALLDAAWLELSAHGYAGLTMEGVAARAGTSRPVIARRWTTRAQLAIAAIRQQMARHPLDVEDRGALRPELLDFLARASRRATSIAAAFTLFTTEFMASGSTNPEGFHAALVEGEEEVFLKIVERGVQRGEIDPSCLSMPVTTLLPDLFRYYVVMNFQAPAAELQEAWVDTIFLPLVRPTGKKRK